MQRANEIKVGDVVEFEVGCPVRVVSIEDNWGEGVEPHPTIAFGWPGQPGFGRSLVFDCVDATDDNVSTFYVRRELSPLSGPTVQR
jgi:hypothetical protein